MQSARVTVFTVTKLLREKQGVKLPIHPNQIKVKEKRDTSVETLHNGFFWSSKLQMPILTNEQTFVLKVIFFPIGTALKSEDKIARLNYKDFYIASLHEILRLFFITFSS